jgi:lipopolysaccharide heptosyltransferase I
VRDYTRCREAHEAVVYTGAVRALPERVRERIADRGRDLSILIVRLGALGDILRTLPAVRRLRAHLPEARIAWTCDERWAPILAEHPDLDGVVPFPRGRMRGIAALSTILDLRRALRAFGADVALDFHGNLRSGLVSFLSGASVRIGYEGHQQKEGNRLFTTHRVSAGPRRTSRVERNLDLARSLGVPDGPGLDAGLPHTVAAVRDARALVARVTGGDGPYAILSPGASRAQAYKKPPAALLAAAARQLAELGIAPLVAYGPGEDLDAARVVQGSDGAAHLLPPTDLAMLAALLRRARLFCGGDSGPLHLACAVGCPVVAIYGPTDPVVNSPWGVPHRAVSPEGREYTGVKRVDRQKGFEGISEDAVRRAVVEVRALSDRAGSRSRTAF